MYLVVHRPGQTSITSLGLMAIMLTPVLLSAIDRPTLRRAMLGVGVLLTLVVAGRDQPRPWISAQVAHAADAQQTVAVLEAMRQDERSYGPHIWVMPNESSIGAAWAFSYSGQMGLYPVVLDEREVPAYATAGGHLLSRFFGGMMLVPFDHAIIGAALADGWPIVWGEADTDPETDRDRWLQSALDAAGYQDRQVWTYAPGRRVVVARPDQTHMPGNRSLIGTPNASAASSSA